MLDDDDAGARPRTDQGEQTPNPSGYQPPDVDDIEALEDYVDTRFAELVETIERAESRLDDSVSELRDEAARDRALIRQRVSEVEEGLDSVKSQVHHGRDERLLAVQRMLVESALDSTGKASHQAGRGILSSQEIADALDVSPRSARNYMSDLDDEYESISYRRLKPTDATSPKRLCVDVDDFLDESDAFGQQ